MRGLCLLLACLVWTGCTTPKCGDSIVDTSLNESCDDGNTDDTDACLSSCSVASCGDGFLQNGVEVCDDGNTADNDDCLSSCTPNVCGDGILNELAEECDDGNTVDNDGCNADCSLTVAAQLIAGATHTCALLNSGTVRCWGNNSSGQLGYGNSNNIGDDETPASAGDVNVGGVVTQLAAGFFHTCARVETGSVRCWGSSFDGQLGYGNTASVGDDETPSDVGDVNVGGTVLQVTAGEQHTCALLDTGTVRCWGIGTEGRLGYGNIITIGDNEPPATAGDVNVGGNVIQISAGARHTCALLDTGAVRCWGLNTEGQLGYGNTNSIGDDETPATAGDVNVGGNVIQISAGSRHTCALLETGAVRCWGLNAEGQLGYGNTNSIGDDEVPSVAGDVNVGGPATQLSNGEAYTCAVLSINAIRCWGRGQEGQLGYGNTNDIGDNEAPTTAGNTVVGEEVRHAATGKTHTCAITRKGSVRCWGDGNFGRLGYLSLNRIGDDETPSTAGDVTLF